MAAVTRYSTEMKQTILHYKSLGFSSLEIQAKLQKEYNIRTTRQGIWHFCKRYEKTGECHGRRAPSRARKVNDLHMQFIDMWLEREPEMTAQVLKDRLAQVFDLQLCIQYVRKLRRSLGWECKQVQYCQLVSTKNKAVRLDWCLEALISRETFSDVIFTDETGIEMSSAGRLFFYKVGSEMQNMPKKAPKPKHAYKVLMWAGISYRGRTDCCVFKGIMDSVIYQQILADNLLPFADVKFPDGYRLYQDNDSKHKSHSTMKWMEECGLKEKLLTTPASSPDLNPIENVWSELKGHLQKEVKPRTKDELVAGIKAWWENLSAARCGRFIDHIHRVIPQVVLNDGTATVF